MGTVAYARQALLDAAHYRDSWAAYERIAAWPQAAAVRLRARRLAGRAGRQAGAGGDRDPRERHPARARPGRRVQGQGRDRGRHAGLVRSPTSSRPARCPAPGQRELRSAAAGRLRPAGDEDKERRDIEEAEKNPAALHAAGVPFALVSGHAPDFLAGVRKAIERGLPREAALRAVTLAPAEALGVRDRLGSLERGQDRQRRGLVGRAARPRTRRRSWCSWTASSTSPTRSRRRPRLRTGQPGTTPTPTPAAAPMPDRRRRAGRRSPPPRPPPCVTGRAARRRRPKKTFAIMGGTVLTVGPQGTIPNGTVLVRGRPHPRRGRGHPRARRARR